MTTLDEIRKRLDASPKWAEDLAPFLRSFKALKGNKAFIELLAHAPDDIVFLLAEIDSQKAELDDRRQAMSAIYWLNINPRIDAICTEVYEKWSEK